MKNIPLIDYYKYFIRTYGIIVLIIGGLLLLSLLPIEKVENISAYLFPPLGKYTYFPKILTIILIGLVTVVVFFQKERQVIKTSNKHANFFVGNLFVIFIGLISFLYCVNSFVLVISSPNETRVLSKGYERKANIDKTLTDEDLLWDYGVDEDGVKKIWTNSSIIIARSILYLTYLLTILSIVALCSFAVLFDLSAMSNTNGPESINSMPKIKDKEIPMKKILFVMANPTDTSKLRLDKEFREVDNGLRLANLRDNFELEISTATRPNDLRREMLRYSPQFVHFSGHGATEGIILEDENGNSKVVETNSLADLFSLFSDFTECVVLNSCYSEKQAKAIGKHIPFVVGMNTAVPDIAAIEFAIGFYDAIGAGRNIEDAYKFGKNAIDLNRVEGKDIPVLMKK